MESATKNRQSQDAIIAMVHKAYGDDIKPQEIEIKELTDGFFNVAYEIGLPDRKVILKIAPPAQIQVMSYEKNMMFAEVTGLRMVKEQTDVPVPKIFLYDNSKSICDADYFFMEKLPGENFYKLKNSGMSDDIQKNILFETGRLNREINMLKGERYGYIGLPEQQGTSWKETFLAMMEGILRDGENIEIDLGVDYNKVRELILKASFSLEEIDQPAFIHWDLWEGNIFIQDNKITGFIDFERALWGDPLMEYFFRRHVYNASFCEGYGIDLRSKAPIRALLYDIYLFALMVIETKYRNYPDDGQYIFSTRELSASIHELNTLL